MTEHALLCVDSASMCFFEIDRDARIVFTKQLPGIAFDIWQLQNGDVLCPFYGAGKNGFIVFDRAGHEKRTFLLDGEKTEIFGCQPMANGDILIAHTRTKTIDRIDPENRITARIPLFYDAPDLHETMRMPRLALDQSSVWLVQPGLRKIIRYAFDGQILEQIPTRRDTFDVIEQENDTLLYSSIEGVFEIDRTGRELWSLTAADIPEMGFKWALTLRLLRNGNIALCNWLGHGHDREGVPVFEVARDKQVVWSCPVQDQIENLSSFLFLD